MSGTRDYLSNLDLAQLRYARDAAEAMIREKEEQKKRVVWIVCDNFMNIGTFPEDGYVKAAKALFEEAKRLDASGADNHSRELRVCPRYVAESEYESWIS